jgi:hypothetical protein
MSASRVCSNSVTLTFFLGSMQTCTTTNSATTCVSQTPADFGFPSATVNGFKFILACAAIICALGGLGLVVAVLILLKETKVAVITERQIMGWLIAFSWLAFGFALAALITWGAVVFPYLLILTIIGNVFGGITTVNLAGLGLIAGCLL